MPCVSFPGHQRFPPQNWLQACCVEKPVGDQARPAPWGHGAMGPRDLENIWEDHRKNDRMTGTWWANCQYLRKCWEHMTTMMGMMSIWL